MGSVLSGIEHSPQEDGIAIQRLVSYLDSDRCPEFLRDHTVRRSLGISPGQLATLLRGSKRKNIASSSKTGTGLNRIKQVAMLKL